MRPWRLDEGGFGGPGTLPLGAGETYQQKVLLNEWYDFVEPGKYVIEAKLVLPVRALSGHIVGVGYSGPAEMSVEPRNPKRLDGVCSALTTTALRSRDAAEASNAAFALTYVEDLTAVPYLARIATAREALRWTAIDGLARIARAEGIRLVTSRLTTEQAGLFR